MEMPLYQRHKIIYNFMKEKEQEKKAIEDSRRK